MSRPGRIPDGLEVDRSREGLQFDTSKQDVAFPDNKEEEAIRRHKQRLPFGLSLFWFTLLVMAVTALIVGAIVGGSVGGALSSSNSSSNTGAHVTASPTPQTVTVTTTATVSAGSTIPTTDLENYSVALPEDVNSLSWDCPNADGTQFLTKHLDPAQTFQMFCGYDYSNHIPAVGGGIVGDILGTVAYSAVDCMTACASFNVQQTVFLNDTRCMGISFIRSMSTVVGAYGGTCWLKNGTAVNPQPVGNTLIAALITS